MSKRNTLKVAPSVNRAATVAAHAASITACARKLLIILNAMVRTRKPFDAALHLG